MEEAKMNWKILSLACLIVLTMTVVAYELELSSTPSRLYLYSVKWAERAAPSFINSTGTIITLDDLTPNLKMGILDYLEASGKVGRIDLSDEWVPILEWAESMFSKYARVNEARFNIKYGEDYFYVSLWSYKSYNPSPFSSVLSLAFFATISLWLLFAYKNLRTASTATQSQNPTKAMQ